MPDVVISNEIGSGGITIFGHRLLIEHKDGGVGARRTDLS